MLVKMVLSECRFSKLVLRNKWENGNEACKYTIAIFMPGKGDSPSIKILFWLREVDKMTELNI